METYICDTEIIVTVSPDFFSGQGFHTGVAKLILFVFKQQTLQQQLQLFCTPFSLHVLRVRAA